MLSAEAVCAEWVQWVAWIVGGRAVEDGAREEGLDEAVCAKGGRGGGACVERSACACFSKAVCVHVCQRQFVWRGVGHSVDGGRVCMNH